MNSYEAEKLVCEKCGAEYEQYEVSEYISELNGNDYCKTCRDFLKTKVKTNGKKKIKVRIKWSYYALPGFEPAPDGHGYVRKKKGGDEKSQSQK